MPFHHYELIAGAETFHTPAVGFSNGAIMAAALLMLYPHLLSGAVLFRPLSPFAADPRTSIPGSPVLITDGSDDHRRSPGDAALLASRLARLGASVRTINCQSDIRSLNMIVGLRATGYSASCN